MSFRLNSIPLSFDDYYDFSVVKITRDFSVDESEVLLQLFSERIFENRSCSLVIDCQSLITVDYDGIATIKNLINLSKLVNDNTFLAGVSPRLAGLLSSIWDELGNIKCFRNVESFRKEMAR